MAYKCGQEVFRDPKPFTYYVFPIYRKVVCDWCLKMCEDEGILKACAKCKWVYYCDQSCQKEAWNSHHKSECKYLQRQNMPEKVKEIFDGQSELRTLILELMRTILKLKNKGGEEFFQLPSGEKRHYADLISNADELWMQKEESNQYEVFYFMYANFEIWLGDTIPSFKEFFDIFGKWRTNGSGICAMNLDDPFIVIASGLYLGYSALDHSCSNNAIWINDGKEMIVRTIEDVENFSEIRICYIDKTEKTHKRKQLLKEQYFFDCKCLRCEDPNSDAKHTSLKCKNCLGWVNDNTKICSGCHQKLKLSDEELAIIEKYKNGTLPKFEPTMTTKEIRSILKKYVKIFHAFHEIFYQCEEEVLDSPNFALQGHNYEDMLLRLELRKLGLNYYSGHIPKFYKDFVFYHREISYACITLKLFDEAEFHLKKAEEICKVAYGEDHPYMQECQKSKMELRFARILALK